MRRGTPRRSSHGMEFEAFAGDPDHGRDRCRVGTGQFVDLNRRMNIAHYSPYALSNDTGTGNSILGWCEALARRDCDVTLLVDGRLTSRPAPNGVRDVPIKHLLQRRMT